MHARSLGRVLLHARGDVPEQIHIRHTEVAPLVERAGFDRLPLVLGRGANPGVARAGDQPSGEDENLRAFFRATRDGMIPTLRLQAELRRNDLLWRPVEAARATIDIVRAVAPDAILVDHLAFGATLGLRAAGIPYADVVLGHPTALPVAGERYAITLPDGTIRRGRLDQEGFARVDRIDQGTCDVTFPDLDGRRWARRS